MKKRTNTGLILVKSLFYTMWHFDQSNVILMTFVEYLLSQNKEIIMPRINITTIKKLEFTGKPYRIFDDKLSGFGVANASLIF